MNAIDLRHQSDLPQLKLIKSKERVRDAGEVFTPTNLVNQMLSQFPPDAWDKSRNWLEPTCGNGAFIVAIITHKIAHGSTLIQALNTTFGLDIMADNISECHQRIYAEVVIPYFKSHKVYGARRDQMLLQSICIIETNIRHTQDTLDENLNEKFEYFADLPEELKIRIRDTVVDTLVAIDNNKALKTRLYKELLFVFGKAL